MTSGSAAPAAAAAKAGDVSGDICVIVGANEWGSYLRLPIREDRLWDGSCECTYEPEVLYNWDGELPSNAYSMEELGLSNTTFWRLFGLYELYVNAPDSEGARTLYEEAKQEVIRAANEAGLRRLAEDRDEETMVGVVRQYGEMMLQMPIRVTRDASGEETCVYSTTLLYDEEGNRYPHTYTMRELGLPAETFFRAYEVYERLVTGAKGMELHVEFERLRAKIVDAVERLNEQGERRRVGALRDLVFIQARDEMDYEEWSDAPLPDEERWVPQQGDVEWEEETRAALAKANGWTEGNDEEASVIRRKEAEEDAVIRRKEAEEDALEEAMDRWETERR